VGKNPRRKTGKNRSCPPQAKTRSAGADVTDRHDVVRGRVTTQQDVTPVPAVVEATEQLVTGLVGMLLVEDDPELSAMLAGLFAGEGYHVDIAADGQRGLHLGLTRRYEVIVLDRRLRGIEGLDLMGQWRRHGIATPVLVLSALGTPADRITGLDAGAEDYLTKPFDVEELLARLRALARRPPSPLGVTLRVADLEIDTSSHAAQRAGRRIKLTAREYALLEYLMRNPNRVVTRGQILEHVWDDNFDPVGNVVDVLVGRVRRKVDLPGLRPLIHTERGAGYRLSEEPHDAG